MTSKTIKPIIIEPCGKHTATVIFLHGEGDGSFEWVEKLVGIIDCTYTRLIFPRAATIAMAAYNGMKIPAWFYMNGQEYSSNLEDINGINSSYQSILKIIQREMTGTTTCSGIPASRIVLVGFSQGGSLAFHVGLNAPIVLGGVINLSGHLPLFKNINWDEVKKPRFMICQGDSDPALPVNRLLTNSKTLRCFLDVVFHIYDGVEHDSCQQELHDIQEFVAEQLPA